MTSKIFFRGAEAIILLDKDNIKRDQNLKEGLIKRNPVPFIIKKRIKKSYRLPELDEKIRKLRTRAETKLLEKASKKILVPKVFNSNEKTKEISMEFIKGKRLSKYLDNFSNKKQLEIFKKIGENIAKIHDSDIIHGDLTTSNLIFNEKNNRIYFIDFGLGFISHKIEDKAVDLHLLKQALEANHFRNWKKLFNEIIKGYKISKDCEQVFERLNAVESRGRYKEKY